MRHIPVQVGQRFGRWTAISTDYKVNFAYHVDCQCECGSKKTVLKSNLLSGKSVSCGCFCREQTSSANTTHGWSQDPMYAVWKAMRQRCANPNNTRAASYSGRGIMICDRWYYSFKHFLEDMGPRPLDKHSIDRIDNNGDYEPGNCRWATNKEQCNNTRNNINLEFRGRIQTLTQWAEEIGISVDTMKQRYYAGWSTERMLTTPTGGR